MLYNMMEVFKPVFHAGNSHHHREDNRCIHSIYHILTWQKSLIPCSIQGSHHHNDTKWYSWYTLYIPYNFMDVLLLCFTQWTVRTREETIDIHVPVYIVHFVSHREQISSWQRHGVHTVNMSYNLIHGFNTGIHKENSHSP